jgi:hypothetical protein
LHSSLESQQHGYFSQTKSLCEYEPGDNVVYYGKQPFDVTLINGYSQKYFKMKITFVNNQYIFFTKFGDRKDLHQVKSGEELTKLYQNQSDAIKEWSIIFQEKTLCSWKSYVVGKYGMSFTKESYYVQYIYDDPDYDPDDYPDKPISSSISIIEYVDFTLLPDDIVFHVLEFCEIQDIGVISQMNQRYNKLMKTNPKFWLVTFNNLFRKKQIYTQISDSMYSRDTRKVKEDEYHVSEIKLIAAEYNYDTGLSFEILQKLTHRIQTAREVDMQNSKNTMDTYLPNDIQTIITEVARIMTRKKLKTKTISIRRCVEMDTIEPHLQRLLNMKYLSQIRRLDIMDWNSMKISFQPIINELTRVTDFLKHIEALDVADNEICQLNHITLGDFTPLLKTWSTLKYLDLKGSKDLSLTSLTHYHLRSITIVACHLTVDFLPQIFKCNMPNLIHLDLYLGDMSPSDYRALRHWIEIKRALSSLFTQKENGIFPSLLYLGLQNSKQIDDFLDIIVSSALIKRIFWLNISKGCLGDVGATQLLKLKDIDTCLRSISIEHHYIRKKSNIDGLVNLGIPVLGLEGYVNQRYYHQKIWTHGRSDMFY